MSEHEFDAYLALLGGMLGLSDEQREAISGELRDHMLERMDEQMAAGVPRNEAIQQALAEFGDASRLAAGLAAAATLHRRRLIMRWTFGTVVTFGLLLFVGLAYWPAGENGPGPQRSVAQQRNDPTEAGNATSPIRVVPGSALQSDDPNERAFSGLQQLVSVDTIAAPVSVGEFVADLARRVDLQSAINLPPDQMKELSAMVELRLDDVPALTALNLALSRVPTVAVTIRDGALLVTDAGHFHGFIRLYHVRDLLVLHQGDADELAHAGTQLPRLVKERQRLLLDGQADQGERYDKAIVAAAEMLVRETQWPITGRPELIRLIQTIVDPPSWDVHGGPFSMRNYGDVLLVSAPLQTHWEITKTLARLRKYATTDERIDATGVRDSSNSPYYREAIPRTRDSESRISATEIEEQPRSEAGVVWDRSPIAIDAENWQTQSATPENSAYIIEPPDVLSAVYIGEDRALENLRLLVRPDGNISLPSVGLIYVAGKSLGEVRLLLRDALRKSIPQSKGAVLLDVHQQNSKVVYLVFQSESGKGDNVVRLPVVGNESVLDAISAAGAFLRISSKRIWIARPALNGVGLKQELPVDWNAITQHGVTTTNYQILPGDRIFVAANNPEGNDEPRPPQEVPVDEAF